MIDYLWGSLEEALAVYTEQGWSSDEAKRAICERISSRQIEVRIIVDIPKWDEEDYVIEEHDYISVPRKILPDKMDWNLSRPLIKWSCGEREWEEQRWVKVLEVCLDDVRRACPRKAKAEDGHIDAAAVLQQHNEEALTLGQPSASPISTERIRTATEHQIRASCRAVLLQDADGRNPSIKDAWKSVKAHLLIYGKTSTREAIDPILKEGEFAEKRRPRGGRR